MRSAWFATRIPSWRTKFVTLGLSCIVAIAVQMQSTIAGETSKPRVTTPSPKEVKARWIVNGNGAKEADADAIALKVVGTWQKTKEDALQAALEKAQEELLSFFQNRDPSFLWKPDLDYIRTKLVKGTAEESKDFRKDFNDTHVGLMHRATLELQISRREREFMRSRGHDYRRELQDKQRMLIAEYRMHGLSKFFGAAVALLAGLGGYIRLDELTKGYYTHWLRLAAASLIGAVGAGLWFLA
jgi:hypothetical protein